MQGLDSDGEIASHLLLPWITTLRCEANYFQLTLFKESVLTLLKLDMEQDSKFQTMAMEGDNKSDEENGSQEVNISKPKSDYFETLCKTLSSGYCILIISIYLVIVVNNFTENKGDHSPHIEVSVNV